MSESRSVQIEGGIPLVGTVKASGSKTLSLKLIYTSILCGEECILNNVPHIDYVTQDLDLAADLGITTTWISRNKLLVNSQGLNSFTIPQKGKDFATSAFFVPSLVHKFGKAVFPQSKRAAEYRNIWESFGLEVREDLENYYIETTKLHGAEIVLPYPSRSLTDLSIISALFVPGETIIMNSSTDVETDDLIGFCNTIGAHVERGENKTIFVKGSGVFTSVNYHLPFDREEAAFYVTATLLTNGNTTIKGIERSRFLPFINWLSKIGANYEFTGPDMRVWHNSGVPFEKTNTVVSPHPGFSTDFSPLAVFLSCFAEGESVIIENSKATNLDYIPNLNHMGAKIDMCRDDQQVEITVSGPVTFPSGRIGISGLKTSLVSLLYCLSVEGKNILDGYDVIEKGFEDTYEKLKGLGASIEFGEL